MNDLKVPFIIFILGLLGVLILGPPAHGACILSHCKDKNTAALIRSHLTNIHRQKVGDFYAPGRGQRTQIRDTSRRIIGYIERSGRITNLHRQKIGESNE